MKKVLLSLGVLPVVLLFSGCSKSQVELVKENMSEITYTYFYGKCDEFEISLSSGEREEPYVYNGKNEQMYDFGLVVAKLKTDKEKESMIFSINGDATSEVLEYNMVTGTYMLDLERSFDEGDLISVKYGNTQITLDCLSKEFKVGYDKAIDIGVNEFSEEISKMLQKDELKAECYLKILDNLSNGFDSRFWCFSIVNEEGEHLNCVIDVESGEITAKT